MMDGTVMSPGYGCASEKKAVDAGGVLTFAYGLVSYASFLVVFLYAIGFVGNWIVAKSIDTGTAGPVIPRLLINALLLIVFVLQHTIMARPAFKRWWVQIVPKSAER